MKNIIIDLIHFLKKRSSAVLLLLFVVIQSLANSTIDISYVFFPLSLITALYLGFKRSSDMFTRIDFYRSFHQGLTFSFLYNKVILSLILVLPQVIMLAFRFKNLNSLMFTMSYYLTYDFLFVYVGGIIALSISGSKKLGLSFIKSYYCSALAALLMIYSFINEDFFLISLIPMIVIEYFATKNCVTK